MRTAGQNDALEVIALGATVAEEQLAAVVAHATLVIVLLSLGGSLFCLRLFLGGTWISVYVFPTVYIVIGVGADDLFFLIAAWFDEAKPKLESDGGGLIVVLAGEDDQISRPAHMKIFMRFVTLMTKRLHRH